MTLNATETWGKKVVLDPLAPHFKCLFDSAGLLDIAPIFYGPTWRNGRIGDDGISKRLERFLLSSALIPSLKIHRTWIHHADISDHYPIYLEWDKSVVSCSYPYKFNRSWLFDPDFNLWVTKRWPELDPLPSPNYLDNLTHKLRSLKRDVKSWTQEKENSMKSDAMRLDKNIETLLSGSFLGILTQEDQYAMTQLRSQKQKL